MTVTPPRAGDSGPGGPVAPLPGGHRYRPVALPPDGSGPGAPLPDGPEPVALTPDGPWSDPDAAFYTVGQVGDLLGVPPATLRRFDTADAVRPARSTGGQRRYSHRQLEHARRLLRLIDEGLPLTAATRVADLEDTVARLQQQLSTAGTDLTASPRPGPTAPDTGPADRSALDRS